MTLQHIDFHQKAPTTWLWSDSTLTTSWYVDVEGETVLALVNQRWQQFPQVLVAADWHLQQCRCSIRHVRKDLCDVAIVCVWADEAAKMFEEGRKEEQLGLIARHYLICWFYDFRHNVIETDRSLAGRDEDEEAGRDKWAKTRWWIEQKDSHHSSH